MLNETNIEKGLPLVSVIMPVYNTEAYLREAVGSILNQTYSSLEIIAVNDGSTDGSMQVLETMAAEDNRVRVLSQANAGQSAARNYALTLAKGDYVYFMDSDDILKPDTFSKCVTLCEDNNLDFCFFDAEAIFPDGSIHPVEKYDRTDVTDENTVYTGNEALKLQLDSWKLCTAPWPNFIRHSFFKEAKMDFYRGIIHEDELFTVRLYMRANRVMSIHQRYYQYRERNDSTMGRKFGWRNLNGYFTVADELLTEKPYLLEKQQSLLNEYLCKTMDAAIWRVRVMPFKDKIKVLSLCYKKYRPYIRLKTYLSVLLKK